MLRSLALGASILAIAPFAASAQEAAAPEAGADAAVKTETVAIMDASQVATKEEAKLYAASEFDQADLDQDGNIDKDEFIAYASVRAPVNDPALSIPDEVVESDDAAAETIVEGDSTAATTAEEQFAELSNGDEQISESELIDKRVAQFDEADDNKDEELDTEERMKFASLTALKSPGSAL